MPTAAPAHSASSKGSLKRVNRSLSSSRSTWRRQVNPGVLVASLALISYGALVVWTASLSIPAASFPRQMLGIGIGLVMMIAVWRLDLKNFANLSTALLIIDLMLIFSPYVPGLSYTAKGMTGWIKVPLIGLTFQPVELVKLVTILFISSLGAQYNGRIDTVRDYLKLCGMLAAPVLAIIALRDLGSSLVVLFSGAVVIMMSGARKEWVLSTIAVIIGVVSLILATNSVMHSVFGDRFTLIKDYQMKRLLVFIDPNSDRSGSGYNLQQALIAVGSGGFFGKGIGHATQSAAGFLPEAQTDFVFALLSEEFGFAGSFILLILFAWLMFSTIRVAMKTDNLFMKLVCVGIVGMWTFQVFENVGMCIQLMPITGIPLPFISFGSSSMIIQCMAVGIVQSVWRHRVQRS